MPITVQTYNKQPSILNFQAPKPGQTLSDDDLSKQLQALIASVQGNSNGTNSSQTSLVATNVPGNNALTQAFLNPNTASVLGFLVSTLGVLGINFGIKQYKNLTADTTETTKVAKALLNAETLSKEEIAQIYSRALDFILNPEKIKLPKCLDSMYPTKADKIEALKEYKKFVIGFSKALLSGHIPMFTFDWDGTKASKTAFFVSFTGATNSDEDRANVQSEMLYMNKLKGLAQIYNDHIRKPDEDKIDSKELALYHILSMRSVGWDGQSFYRVQRTPQMNGEQPGSYSNGSIDGICAELGLDPKLVLEALKNPDKVSIFDTISIAGFGGPLRIKNGGDIEFVSADGKTGKEGAAYFAYVGEIFNRADRDSSSNAAEHRAKLQKITSINDFIKEYEDYLPGGSKENVKIGGYFEELAFVTSKLGLGVLERKGVPKYLLEKEWHDKARRPSWRNDLLLAHYLEEAKEIDLRGGDWKSYLREKFVGIQKGAAPTNGQVEIPQSLFKVFNQASSFTEFKNEARQASLFMITSHAIDGLDRFVNVSAKTYDYYKEVILKGIVQKYLAKEGELVKDLAYGELPEICKDVASIKGLLRFKVNIANNGDKAPYLEVSPEVNKASAFADLMKKQRYLIQIGAGDSQGTDAGMLVSAINDGYSKGKLGAEQFKNNIIPFMKEKGATIDTSAVSSIAKEMEDKGLGLSIKVRGQIDLQNDTALNHYITQAINKENTPFHLQVDYSSDGEAIRSIQLVGKEFGTTETIDPSCVEYIKGKYTLKKGDNRLRQLLLEKAVPFYEERIVSATDVHQNDSMTSSVLHLMFGNDPDKIDHSALASEISAGNDPQHLRWGANYMMLCHESDERVEKILGVTKSNNVQGLKGAFIRNSPVIGGSISNIGALMSIIGVVGEIYDNITHDNKYDDSFRNIITKGFSLANLGLFITTTAIKPIFWPFQVLGSLLGISSGFVPPGNVQQFMALGSITSSLLGWAREISWGETLFIDGYLNEKDARGKLNYQDPRFMSATNGIGEKTYLDIKGINSLHQGKTEDRMKGLTEFFMKFGFGRKASAFLAKPIDDFRWNMDALVDVVREPGVLKFTNRLNATNGFKYEKSPISMSHFVNLGGWATLGLMGLTGILHFVHDVQFKNKNKDANEDTTLKNIKPLIGANGKVLFDPRLSFTPENNQSTDKDSVVHKMASLVAGMAALVPALIFIVQANLRRQNASGNRLSWSTENGRQVRYQPGVLGNSLLIASSLQALSALSVSFSGFGLFGNAPWLTNISQSVYNLAGGLALAAMGKAVEQGDSIGYVRDRLKLERYGYMGDPDNHFQERATWKKKK